MSEEIKEPVLEYKFYLRPLDVHNDCITNLVWFSYSMEKPIMIRAKKSDFTKLICAMNKFGLELERIENRDVPKWNDYDAELIRY